ncbi:dephospho-CoA kinase [Catenovulum agarivorans]|uniref:dephospho-CoA kinase n=1 Tax=Catenovulum agarivorans TaxID=1172192 RepID=UPI0002DA4C16|nr:dephospho-CoA kinase [Catenovulum agarivorans]
MSQFIVGLTGGIGSGKTTVSNMFADLGVTLIDADIIAREVVAPNSPALEQIRLQFGDDILDIEGKLNRGKLRQVIFTQPAAKAWLDNLLHPIIRQKMYQECQQAQSPYCLLIVPLLLENNLQEMTDRVLITDCFPQTQLSRAVKRDNNSPQLILSIMNKQISRAKRLALSDDLINTELSIAQIQQDCLSLHLKYLELAKLKALS